MKEGSSSIGIGIFWGITYFLSWLFWAPALFKSYGIDLSMQEDLFVMMGNFMPSILGLIFITLSRGREGLLKLFKQVIKVKFSPRWYLFSLFLMPLTLVSAYLIGHIIMDLEFESILLPILSSNVLQAVPIIVYFIIFQGPLGEELGWRGYVLPRLLQRFEPIKASLVMGIIWTGWHLPKFFLLDSTQYSLTDAYGIVLAFIGYTIYTLMLSIMITFLFLKTRKSIFAVLLFHAMANFSHGLVTILTSNSGAMSTLLLMFIITVLISYSLIGEGGLQKNENI